MIKIIYIPSEKKSRDYGKGVKMFSGRALAKTHATCAEQQKKLSGDKVVSKQSKQKK